jgi:putative membrane protein insertion efficiency factor
MYRQFRRNVGADGNRPANARQRHPLLGGTVRALIQSFKTIFLMQGAVCKFEPSCSRYAQEAFEKLPIHIAIIKVIWRILRCNPFSKGGFDPVL